MWAFWAVLLDQDDRVNQMWYIFLGPNFLKKISKQKSTSGMARIAKPQTPPNHHHSALDDFWTSTWCGSEGPLINSINFLDDKFIAPLHQWIQSLPFQASLVSKSRSETTQFPGKGNVALGKSIVHLVGGFKDFLFSPRTLGKWSNLTYIYFSNGLVQPPTSPVLTSATPLQPLWFSSATWPYLLRTWTRT